jgi:UPF0716 protein FxsA
MLKILIIAFVLVPLVELYVLIQVGSELGALTTLFLCLFTAALGAFLLRLQGIETLARVQSRIQQGKMPATDLIEGFILLISGALLLTPGFLTDIAGFLCLMPGLRTRIAIYILRNMVIRHRADPHSETIIVEGEFWDEEEKRNRIDSHRPGRDR